MALDMQTQMRLTGMASGLDTDALIQNLGKVHNLRINKVKQDKQLLVWKQEMYRDTISKISSFMKSNLNISNPASNFRSSAAFAKFSYSLKGTSAFNALGLNVNDVMSVTANGDLKNFNQTVQAVAQLATKDTYVGSNMTSLQGITTKGLDYYKLGIVDSPNGTGVGYAEDIKWAVFGVSIDGTSKTISISPAELKQAYESETGGQYKALSGVDRTDAIDAVKAGTANGLFMRREDGSIGEINEGEIVKWYQNLKGSNKFNDPDHPTAAEKDLAIDVFFANNAIYKKEDKVALSGTEQANAIQNIINGGNTSGLSLRKSDGSYVAVDKNVINDWYLSNGGNFVGATPTDAEQETAINDYFASNDIYKDPSPRSSTALADLISEKIRQSFGNSFSNVVTATSNGELKFEKKGSTITLFDQVGFDAVGKGMGLSGGASTAGAVTNRKLTEFVDGSFFDNVGALVINGVNIKLTRDDTIGTLMTKINGSEAGVTLSYTNSTGSFTLASKQEGTANIIKMGSEATAMFFGEFGIARGDGYSAAKNFVGVINGEEYIRQSNSFTHEGMTFTFNETFNASMVQDGFVLAGVQGDPNNPYSGYEVDPATGFALDGNGNPIPNMVIKRDSSGNIEYDPAASIKIDVTKNTADIVTGIKGFVEEYNKLVTHINDLIKGQRVYKKGSGLEYPPLTDDERKAMSKEEAALYDDKAKQGLLGNDSDLRKLLNEMRSALYQKVEGVGLTMADIGITTSANYMDGGTLVIDENKLKAALDKDYDGVVSLFTKSSSVPASDRANAGKRFSESGIGQRLNDILNDAAGTTATSGKTGEKGYLLKKAGMVNDATFVDNPMTKKIGDYDKKIDQLLERWYRQENAYYMMFARMETAMSKLQSQQNSLAQIMAAGGK
jgi:flagellar hook-associated protein 2